MSYCVPFQIGNSFGILCCSVTIFRCPYCSIEFHDDNEKYLKRINNNISMVTKVKCICGNHFGVTADIKGDLIGFKLSNKLIPIHVIINKSDE